MRKNFQQRAQQIFRQIRITSIFSIFGMSFLVKITTRASFYHLMFPHILGSLLFTITPPQSSAERYSQSTWYFLQYLIIGIIVSYRWFFSYEDYHLKVNPIYLERYPKPNTSEYIFSILGMKDGNSFQQKQPVINVSFLLWSCGTSVLNKCCPPLYLSTMESSGQKQFLMKL